MRVIRSTELQELQEKKKGRSVPETVERGAWHCLEHILYFAVTRERGRRGRLSRIGRRIRFHHGLVYTCSCMWMDGCVTPDYDSKVPFPPLVSLAGIVNRREIGKSLPGNISKVVRQERQRDRSDVADTGTGRRGGASVGVSAVYECGYSTAYPTQYSPDYSVRTVDEVLEEYGGESEYSVSVRVHLQCTLQSALYNRMSSILYTMYRVHTLLRSGITRRSICEDPWSNYAL